MINNNKSSILLYMCLFITGVLVIPVLASCGKDNSASLNSNANARLQIVNLSPDIQPFNLYANFIKQGTSAYYYPSASNYFLMNVADTPLQIRTAQTSNNVSPTNLLTLGKPLQTKVPYTWFVTGLLADSSIKTIFTVDTGSVPAIGRGKIRFVNAAPTSPAINLTANDTIAFKNVKYSDITNYVELTAGSYNINVTPTSTPSTVLTTSKNFAVLDGKLYTFYFYGISNSADSAKYSIGSILNTLPPGTKY